MREQREKVKAEVGASPSSTGSSQKDTERPQLENKKQQQIGEEGRADQTKTASGRKKKKGKGQKFQKDRADEVELKKGPGANKVAEGVGM